MKCEKCEYEQRIAEGQAQLLHSCKKEEPSHLDKLRAVLDEIGVEYELHENNIIIDSQWVCGDSSLIKFDKDGRLVKE